MGRDVPGQHEDVAAQVETVVGGDDLIIKEDTSDEGDATRSRKDEAVLGKVGGWMGGWLVGLGNGKKGGLDVGGWVDGWDGRTYPP